MQQNITIFKVDVLNIYISDNKVNLTYIYLLKLMLTILSNDINLDRLLLLKSV